MKKKQEDRKTERTIDTSKTDSWNPKTWIGRKVKAGEITGMGEILDKGLRVMEPEIADVLMPDAVVDLVMVGQAKGKFGGGQRRVFRQTQKKTNEGNKPSFSTCVLIGNKDGYVGMGRGKARETVPAREKAIRKAKIGIIKIRRGCGSWQCGCKEPHTIPFKVTGKCGSVIVKLIPAPKGTGLRIERECQRIMMAAGIQDVWSRTLGQTRTTGNLINACFNALRKLSSTKIRKESVQELGIIEGRRAI